MRELRVSWMSREMGEMGRRAPTGVASRIRWRKQLTSRSWSKREIYFSDFFAAELRACAACRIPAKLW